MRNSCINEQALVGDCSVFLKRLSMEESNQGSPCPPAKMPRVPVVLRGGSDITQHWGLWGSAWY